VDKFWAMTSQLSDKLKFIEHSERFTAEMTSPTGCSAVVMRLRDDHGCGEEESIV